MKRDSIIITFLILIIIAVSSTPFLVSYFNRPDPPVSYPITKFRDMTLERLTKGFSGKQVFMLTVDDREYLVVTDESIGIAIVRHQ